MSRPVRGESPSRFSASLPTTSSPVRSGSGRRRAQPTPRFQADLRRQAEAEAQLRQDIRNMSDRQEAALREQIVDLRKENNDLALRLSRVERDFGDAQVRLELQQSQTREERAANERHEGEIRALKRKLETANQEARAQAIRNGLLEDDVQQLQRELNETAERAARTPSSAYSASGRSQGDVEQLRADLDRARSEINTLRGEVTSYRIAAEDAERGRKQAQQETAALRRRGAGVPGSPLATPPMSPAASRRGSAAVKRFSRPQDAFAQPESDSAAQAQKIAEYKGEIKRLSEKLEQTLALAKASADEADRRKQAASALGSILTKRRPEDVLHAVAAIRREKFADSVAAFEDNMASGRNAAVEALATDGSARSLALTIQRLEDATAHQDEEWKNLLAELENELAVTTMPADERASLLTRLKALYPSNRKQAPTSLSSLVDALLLIEKDFVDTKHRRAEEEALLHTYSDQGRSGWDQLKDEYETTYDLLVDRLEGLELFRASETQKHTAQVLAARERLVDDNRRGMEIRRKKNLALARSLQSHEARHEAASRLLRPSTQVGLEGGAVRARAGARIV